MTPIATCETCKHWKRDGVAQRDASRADAIERAKLPEKIAPGALAGVTVAAPAGKCGVWENAVTLADMNCGRHEAKKT